MKNSKLIPAINLRQSKLKYYVLWFCLFLFVGGCSKEEVKVSDSKKAKSTTSAVPDDENPPVVSCTTPCYYCPPVGPCPGGAGYQPGVTPPPGAAGRYYIDGSKRMSINVSYPGVPEPAIISCGVSWYVSQQLNQVTVNRLLSAGASSPGSLFRDKYKYVGDGWARNTSADSENGERLGFIIYYHFDYNQTNPDTGEPFTSGPTRALYGTYQFYTDEMTISENP